MELDYSLVEKDIYRIGKSEVIILLKSFGIDCNDNHTQEELRPLLSQIKYALRRCIIDKTLEPILIETIQNPNAPEEIELGALGAHPFQQLKTYLNNLDRTYDSPESESPNSDYEQIHFQRRNSKLFQSGKRLKTLKSNRNVVTYKTFRRVSIPNSSIRPLKINKDLIKEPKMAEHVPLIQAGSFSGLPSENPQDFLDKYSLAATSNNWSNDTKLKLFPAHLSGTALAWFNLYKTKLGQNPLVWEDLKQELVKAFSPLAQAQSLQSIMEHKVQGQNEPTLNYYTDVVTTCRRFEAGIEESRIINYVIQGLRPEICERVLSMNNDTLINLENNLEKDVRFFLNF